MAAPCPPQARESAVTDFVTCGNRGGIIFQLENKKIACCPKAGVQKSSRLRERLGAEYRDTEDLNSWNNRHRQMTFG